MKAIFVSIILCLSTPPLYAKNMFMNANDASEALEYCKEVTDETEALRKAQLIDVISDSTDHCWEGNNWSYKKHKALKSSGATLTKFLPALYIPNNWQSRVEIFVEYDNGKSFHNSCELNFEAKIFVKVNTPPQC